MGESATLPTHRYKAFINFMLSQQQWSGLSKHEINPWLDNFRDCNDSQKKFAYKLLINLIYYSENDLLHALEEGIYQCVYYRSILEKQQTTNFTTSQHALDTCAKEELRKTYFIPLLDKYSPHESGNYIARLMVQKNIISDNQSIFPKDVFSTFKTYKFSRLVIIDDCVGSGKQLEDFWTKMTVSDNGTDMLLQEFCKTNNIEVHYITLFGYDQSISVINQKTEFNNLTIHSVRLLGDTHRVFSDTSYIWCDNDERDTARFFFTELLKDTGIPLYGYNDLDFALIMHQTIPDWSLPLLWKETQDWKLLMRRKNSNA